MDDDFDPNGEAAELLAEERLAKQILPLTDDEKAANDFYEGRR